MKVTTTSNPAKVELMSHEIRTRVSGETLDRVEITVQVEVGIDELERWSTDAHVQRALGRAVFGVGVSALMLANGLEPQA